MFYIQKKLMELICWVCNAHLPVGRCRLHREGEQIEYYMQCERCGKEL
jgi:hypothetical protein